jgi:hypothetical protein
MVLVQDVHAGPQRGEASCGMARKGITLHESVHGLGLPPGGCRPTFRRASRRRAAEHLALFRLKHPQETGHHRRFPAPRPPGDYGDLAAQSQGDDLTRGRRERAPGVLLDPRHRTARASIEHTWSARPSRRSHLLTGRADRPSRGFARSPTPSQSERDLVTPGQQHALRPPRYTPRRLLRTGLCVSSLPFHGHGAVVAQSLLEKHDEP